MKLYFFTAADKNPKYRREAEILIKSGEKYGREIHFYDIPDDRIWHRYKVELLLDPNLPAADKYIYLDSDTILTRHGDWETDECEGIADALYCFPKDRLKHTKGFMRNHTLVIGEHKGFQYIDTVWRDMDFPLWCNSGVIVLKPADRIRFTGLWREWMERIDAHCEAGRCLPDEPGIMFARQEYGLPLLPPRFNWLLKWQPMPDGCVLIHADGNVSGAKRLPYTNEVRKVLEDA